MVTKDDLLDGLVSYWKFDETSGTTASDSHGENDGTLSNSRIFGTDGKINKSADFTKGNDYVSVGTLGNFGSNDVKTSSYSFWIKTTGSKSDELFFGSANDGPTNFAVTFAFNDGNTIQLFTRDTTGKRLIKTVDVSSYTDNTWFHLVAVVEWSSNTLKFYINGEEKSTTTIHSETPTSAVNFQYPLIIGANNNRGTIANHFNGKIDEVGIWSRALSSDEVSTLYDIQKDGFASGSYPFTALAFKIKGTVNLNASPIEGAKVSCINQNTNEFVGSTTSDENGEWEFSALDEYSTDLTTDLVSYWKFDETTGTTASDSHGENEATASNSRIFTSNTETSGKINSGADFTQGDDKITTTIPWSADSLNGESFSYNIWIKNSQTTPGSILRGSTQDRIGLVQSWTSMDASYENKIVFAYASDGTIWNTQLISTSSTNNNEYNMITITSDGSTTKLYVNGVEEDSSNDVIDVDINTFLAFGVHSTGVEAYNGFMDEFGVWSRALSSDEVSTLYDIQKDGYEDGSYPFNKLKKKYHVVASLEDGEDKFNHLSYYDIEPKLEDES